MDKILLDEVPRKKDSSKDSDDIVRTMGLFLQKGGTMVQPCFERGGVISAQCHGWAKKGWLGLDLARIQNKVRTMDKIWTRWSQKFCRSNDKHMIIQGRNTEGFVWRNTLGTRHTTCTDPYFFRRIFNKYLHLWVHIIFIIAWNRVLLCFQNLKTGAFDW